MRVTCPKCKELTEARTVVANCEHCGQRFWIASSPKDRPKKKPGPHTRSGLWPRGQAATKGAA